jgi:Na+/H+-dicarboxylate symporter
MLLAATLGALLVQAVRPGDLDDPARAALTAGAAERFEASSAASRIAEVQAQSGDNDPLPQAFMQIVRDMIPTNIFKAMTEGGTLGIIVFAILLGLALAAGGETTAPAVRFFDAMFDGLMRLVQWVIWLTPLGVFFLMTWTVGSIGLDNLLGPISRYMLVVFAGLFIHGALVLPFILFIFLRRNPYRFMWQMRRPLLTAFGTSSSYATLPVTIEAAETEGGCSKRAARFVLPLGATVNMDGTALYQSVAVIFLFQLYGIELEFAQLVVVIITATLVAVGAAGIPSAGLVLMFIVVNAVNTSLPGEEHDLPLQAIGVIIGVDRILDMCRTTVNVWGDCVGAKLISAIAPDLPEEKEKALA